MNDIDFLEQNAVDAAVNLQWKDAIEFNKKILELDKSNLAAYLRLGFAYLQTSNIKEAKKNYRKALKLQPKNNVALENLERIQILEKKGVKKARIESTILSPQLFIEVLGKTKAVTLVNPGQKNVLAKLTIGQEVNLKIKRRKLEARTKDDEYIGTLPDDISTRLICFIKAKSVYKTYIKEANLRRVVVFIKEELKGKSVANHVSFSVNIQKNIDFGDEKTEHEEEETTDEWEKLPEDIVEEDKEALIGVHTDDLDEDEEE